ncbi:MAG: outer membrane protein assembly factor BamD [Thiobacillaceae bacterium]|nr:outer membrane protein assembly factor BamD [Thiobacillaceae bacterium]MCX7673758.1 outer membrane protein assembly factor BamD [Thiobacillaceae bacterium]MDW8323324.1 outer membrane protein assembly factor BamD [Burkholderiales bacterium]
MTRILAALLLTMTVAGCGLLPDSPDETAKWSASKLYSEAKAQLAEGNYQRAIQLFEKLEARYPYGPYAQQAQLEVAYAHYKDNEPASAIAAAERFIRLYPNHPHVDYAYYLKGLANFVEDRGLLAGLGGQDMSERDPKAAREAFEAFRELATRFPDSKYTPDALARMRYLVNALASHEVHVARYYFKRGAYVAAANRGKYVLEHYPQAPAQEEALYLMAASYDRLGLADLRDDALRVLKLNFPNSPYLTGQDPIAAKERPWWKFW